MHVSLFLTTVISSTQQRTRLRHKASGRIVCVVAMHLMTTSRDGPGVQSRWRSALTGRIPEPIQAVPTGAPASLD